MADSILRASLFALAKQIDLDADRVLFDDWTRTPKCRHIETSLEENALLNCFLKPSATASIADSSGISGARLDTIIRALQVKGLLLGEAQWADERRKHPFVNHKSVWADIPSEARQFENYEEAYAHGVAPWNSLPVASDLLALTPLPGRIGLRLLDVGCGTGHNLPLIHKLGFDCSGIDVSTSAIAQAKSKAMRPSEFVAGSVTALPWPDSTFDVVTDIGCLHCLQPAEIPMYIAEVRRVLVPTGRFLCRSFKPRGREILMAQPIKMERLGYAPEEVQQMFACDLPVELVKEGPVHGFYLG